MVGSFRAELFSDNSVLAAMSAVILIIANQGLRGSFAAPNPTTMKSIAPTLAAIASGIASGAWNDAQIGAFAMAVAWRGMHIDECRDFRSDDSDSA